MMRHMASIPEMGRESPAIGQLRLSLEVRRLFKCLVISYLDLRDNLAYRVQRTQLEVKTIAVSLLHKPHEAAQPSTLDSQRYV